MSNNLENINPYNLSDIYNFLLAQDESYFSSSLTPEGLDTCVKIAEYFSGNLKKEEIISISNVSLKDFIKKHTVKPTGNSDEMNNPEIVGTIKEKAKNLHNKLHPISLDLCNLPMDLPTPLMEMGQEGTFGLSQLPREMRQDAIFEALDGRSLARMSLVSETSYNEIYSKERLENRIIAAKITHKLNKMESFIDAGRYGSKDDYYYMISKARVFIGDYRGAKRTMNKIKSISRNNTKYQQAKKELLTAKIKNGDYEGAINEAALEDKKLDHNESAKLKSRTYYSIAEEYAKKGDMEKANEMLEEGKKYAFSVKDSDQDTIEVKREFPIALSKIGEIDKAKKAAREIGDGLFQAQVLVKIAIDQTEASDYLGAKKTIGDIDFLFKIFGLKEIIKLHLQGKDLNETLAILKEETKEPQNEDEKSLMQVIVSEIIKHLVILGEVQAAKDLFISSNLEDLKNIMNIKGDTLLVLTRALAANRKTEEALDLCAQYDDRFNHALIGVATEIARYDTDKAKEILESAEIDLRDKELELVHILIVGGKFAEAKEAFDKCRYGWDPKEKRLLKIMKEQIERGETHAVLAMMEKLSDFSQVQVYTALITGKMED